ncbi:transposase [Paraburkholderia sp. WSM4179]|nr:transposase [Paraburkholderia sp. WSM4179]
MEIKVLARRGTAVREIARQTGLSRNTVRRAVQEAEIRNAEQLGVRRQCGEGRVTQ